MRNIDDSIQWTFRGRQCADRPYNDKPAIGDLWRHFMSKVFSSNPHAFVAEGDKVIVLTGVEGGG
jgi:hypothetical protein